jgi:hypothetical protein
MVQNAQGNIFEGLEITLKAYYNDRAIPLWDRLSEKGEPMLRWKILRAISHLSNVTYLPLGEGTTRIHIRLRVPQLFVSEPFTCVFLHL